MKVGNGSQTGAGNIGDTLRAAVAFMKLPTFGIVILQGIVGSTPWYASELVVIPTHTYKYNAVHHML